jgi:hypothetical protein
VHLQERHDRHLLMEEGPLFALSVVPLAALLAIAQTGTG